MPSTLVLTAVFGDMILAGAVLGATGVAVASFAINYAVSQLLVRVFGGDQPTQQNQQESGSGNRQQVPPSSANTIPVVYGTAYLGGTFVDAVMTIDQKTMYYVLAISSISEDGQFTYNTGDMYFGDRKITFKTTGNTAAVAGLTDEAGNYDTSVASGDLVQIYLYTSDASGTITPQNTSDMPNTVMGGADIDITYRWPSSNRQMNGLAFAIVKLTYSREANTTQIQPVTFYVNHFLNGAGVAKAGDVWYDYMTNTLYGGAVSPSSIDLASITTLNTYGDETITFSGGSQPRYRINGVINTGENVLKNVDNILIACDSWMAYNTALGQWSVVVNKADATSYYFDDTNIIGEIRVSATDITNSINQIEARFPYGQNRDQTGFVNIQTPPELLYPNEPVNKYSMTINMTNNSVQAQYLANRILEQAREDLVVSFSTTYYGIQVDAGQVISVTNADYGWTDKLFRVIKVNEASLPDGSLGAKLELNEYNALIYDDKDITEFTPAPNSGLAAPSYFSTLTAPTVTSSDPTATVPTFDVQITIPTVGRVTFINLFNTTSATPSASDWTSLAGFENPSSLPFTNGSTFNFLHNSLPAGTYYFGYIVGNDISQSPISALSTAFAWSPVGVGLNVATVSLYQWLATTPSAPTGNSTYTWATSSNSGYTASDGWYVAIPANPGTAGLKLWAATKNINAPSGTVTTTINWTTGTSTAAIAMNGAVGNSARICFARVASNPTPVSGNITTSGGASFPSGAESLTTWGFTATWGANDPNPASTDSLYQADGIYDPNAGTTVWTTPYISSLKVGTLSAITANMGTLTSGDIIVGTSPAVSGTTMTGVGTHLYSNGRFAMGNSTTNITFNGTSAYLNGFTTTAQLYASSSSTEYWTANTQTYDQYTASAPLLTFDINRPIFLLLSSQLGIGVTTSGNSNPPACVTQQTYIQYQYSTNGGSTYTAWTTFGYPIRLSAISANYTSVYGFNRNFLNSGAFNLQFDIPASTTNLNFRIWRRYIAYGDNNCTTVGYFGGVVIPPSYTEVETYFNAATLLALQVKA
tara:strand:+ start:3065 stop:6199 length:3135 start_codon:yes stop_codon:yes gene_type:complete